MPSITSLAIKHKSDKYGSHYYTEIYEKYMSNKKNKNVNILEIGIGGYTHGKGYSDIYAGGESLKIWRDYFKKGKIAGLDIFEKKINLGSRVKIFQGSQRESDSLSKITKKFKKFDFIIDDGSHRYEDVKFSFEYLYNSLKDGGYYFVEDTQSSYIREFGGDGANLNNKKTVINYFKGIVDKINFQEIENPHYKADNIALNTTEIHFYHNMIVIKKKRNLEKSNILVNNRRLVGGKSFFKIRSIIKKTKYFLLDLKAKLYGIIL
jgi:demethylmacrocin O-methyltransferase|tara:strand:- start:99 stop:890 length:792 start_codon:yes stop_codon:yes gene_type:complete